MLWLGSPGKTTSSDDAEAEVERIAARLHRVLPVETGLTPWEFRAHVRAIAVDIIRSRERWARLQSSGGSERLPGADQDDEH